MEATEKLAVIKSRLAQRLFRSRLAAADCRCRMTGVTDRNLLRASHIRPWSKSDDRQRQDPNNGLLLAPHVDMLFDAGYLTFENDGTVRISDRINKDVLKAWGLSSVNKVAPFSSEQAVYLSYHRKHVFDRSS
jgi:predicted restriction endonuclease